MGFKHFHLDFTSRWKDYDYDGTFRDVDKIQVDDYYIEKPLIEKKLADVAEKVNKKILPNEIVNDFNTKNQYGPTNKDALSDGDAMGRGTGGFLDVNNDKIGNSADIMDRIDNIKINKYNGKNPYTIPQ